MLTKGEKSSIINKLSQMNGRWAEKTAKEKIKKSIDKHEMMWYTKQAVDETEW